MSIGGYQELVYNFPESLLRDILMQDYEVCCNVNGATNEESIALLGAINYYSTPDEAAAFKEHINAR